MTDGMKYLAYRLEQLGGESSSSEIVKMSDFLERKAKDVENNLRTKRAAEMYYQAAKLSALDEEFRRAEWLVDEALRLEPENESYVNFRSNLMDPNFLNKLYAEGIDRKLMAEKWGMFFP